MSMSRIHSLHNYEIGITTVTRVKISQLLKDSPPMCDNKKLSIEKDKKEKVMISLVT